MFKGLPLFYEKGQAGETPHSAEFLLEDEIILMSCFLPWTAKSF